MIYSLVSQSSDVDSVSFKIKEGERFLSFSEVMEAWSTSEAFCQFYSRAIVEIGFDAFFWEHPALTAKMLSTDYECTVVKSEALNNAIEDIKPFETFFQNKGEVSFKNLKGDATLIVPCPLNMQTVYTHMGIFLRTATRDQQQSFWKLVGETIQTLVSETPIWVNTSGLGVSWLHVRLDSTPKYYKTLRYK